MKIRYLVSAGGPTRNYRVGQVEDVDDAEAKMRVRIGHAEFLESEPETATKKFTRREK